MARRKTQAAKKARAAAASTTAATTTTNNGNKNSNGKSGKKKKNQQLDGGRSVAKGSRRNSDSKGVYGPISKKQQQNNMKKVAPTNTSDKKSKKKEKNAPTKKKKKRISTSSNSSSSAGAFDSNRNGGKSKKRKRNSYDGSNNNNGIDEDFALAHQLASMSQATYAGGMTLDGQNKSKKQKKSKKNTKTKNNNNKSNVDNYFGNAAGGSGGQRRRTVSINNNNNKQFSSSSSSVGKKIKLPTVGMNPSPCPWWGSSVSVRQQQQQQQKKKQNQDQRRTLLLMNSCFKVNTAAMEQLDEELELFAQYVRLSPAEHCARRYMIEQVQALSKKLFNLQDPEKSVQIFGSFICPNVCVYQSDIDLAIWDVVPPPEEHHQKQPKPLGTHTRFGEMPPTAKEDETTLNSNTEEINQKLPATSSTDLQAAAADRAQRNAKKEERKSRWMALLEELDSKNLSGGDDKQQKDQKSSTNDHEYQHDNDDNSNEGISKVTEDEELVGETQVDVQVNKKNDEEDEKDSSSPETDEDTLFVIDRMGVPSNDPPESNPSSPTRSKSDLPHTYSTPVASNRTDDGDKSRRKSQHGGVESNAQPNDKDGVVESTTTTTKDAVDANIRDSSEGGNESDIESNNDSNTNNGNDNSDDDTADKLEGLHQKRQTNAFEGGDGDGDGDGDDEVELLYVKPAPPDVQIVGVKRPRSDDEEVELNDDDEEEEVQFVGIRRPRGQSVVSLCSATTCSEDERLDESGMEVSYTVCPPAAKRRFTLEGRARTLVVNALYRLAKATRPLAAQNNLHVRKNAKVPIINMDTKFGYECDIAIGGHNGSDTSSFASVQASRFESFSTVVVILKILLSQHRLDKPFTGGIGSYALYVLVSSHIEQHVQLGGGDGPAELLFSFLFRYGSIKHSHKNLTQSMKTRLVKGTIVQTMNGDGTIDLNPCYQIESCVSLFSSCWYKLYTLLQRDAFNPNHSIIQYVVDANKLAVDRAQKKKQAIDHLKSVFGGSAFHREIESSRQQQERQQNQEKEDEKEGRTDNSGEKKRKLEDGNSTGVPDGLPPLYGFDSFPLSSDTTKNDVPTCKKSKSCKSPSDEHEIKNMGGGNHVAVQEREGTAALHFQRRQRLYRRQETL